MERRGLAPDEHQRGETAAHKKHDPDRRSGRVVETPDACFKCGSTWQLHELSLSHTLPHVETVTLCGRCSRHYTIAHAKRGLGLVLRERFGPLRALLRQTCGYCGEPITVSDPIDKTYLRVAWGKGYFKGKCGYHWMHAHCAREADQRRLSEAVIGRSRSVAG